MRIAVVLGFTTLLASVAIGAPFLAEPLETTPKAVPRDAGFPNVSLPLDRLVPTHWKTYRMDTGTYPYGVGNPDASSGLAITLRGPLTVRGTKGQPAQEEVCIWIMPPDYKHVRLIPDQAFVPSFRVGLSAPGTRAFGTPGKHSPSPGTKGTGYLIYFAPFSDVESWPTWEKDIQDFFGIEKLDYAGVRPPSTIQPILVPR